MKEESEDNFESGNDEEFNADRVVNQTQNFLLSKKLEIALLERKEKEDKIEAMIKALSDHELEQ